MGQYILLYLIEIDSDRQIYCEKLIRLKWISPKICWLILLWKWVSHLLGTTSRSPVTLRVQHWAHLWASVCHWDSSRNAASQSLSLSVPSLTHAAAGKSGEEVRRRDFCMPWYFLENNPALQFLLYWLYCFFFCLFFAKFISKM